MREQVLRAVGRLLAIADDASDGEDVRIRKRVGVAAGYITVLAPLTVPLESPAGGIGWAAALALSAFSAGNLIFLARSRHFERFVVALIAAGLVFVFATTVLAGGVLTNSAGLVWAFLVPAYAILALGPEKATPWFVAFLVLTFLTVALDPVIGRVFEPPPYVVQLVFYAQNVGLPLTIVFVLLRYTDIRRRAAEARSDELLTNAIPASIAARLRRGESRIAEAYPEATVVFLDVEGFTAWAHETDPGRVIALLDDLFSAIDALADAQGVEKIKTVGDAYMAVVGAPEPRPDHAEVGVGFAIDALSVVAEWARTNDLPLDARAGVASGPVVGGVIGTRRILFDLWGSTVNTAARMESTGVAGRVQLAPWTQRLVGDRYRVDARSVNVKGLGEMETYLIDPREDEGLHPTESERI